MELLAKLLLPPGYSWGGVSTYTPDQGTGVMTPTTWPLPIPYYVETDPILVRQDRPENVWRIQRVCIDVILANGNDGVWDNATAFLYVSGALFAVVPLVWRQPEGNNFLVGNSLTRWYYYTGDVEFHDPLRFDLRADSLGFGVSVQLSTSSTGTGPFFLVIKAGGGVTKAAPSQISVWGTAENPTER